MGGMILKPKELSAADIITILRQTPFFITFDEESLDQCAKYFSVRNLEQGRVINDADFIVVVSGHLSISTIVPVEKSDAEPKLQKKASKHQTHIVEKLCVKKPGDFFSKASHEVMSSGKGNKVAAKYDFTTVKALGKCQLLVLNKKSHKKFSSTYSDKAQLLDKVLSVDFNELLRPVPFLHNVSNSKINMLAEMFSFESFNPGDVVVSEGEESNKFYVVLSGQLQVTASKGTLLKENDPELLSFKSVKSSESPQEYKPVNAPLTSTISSRVSSVTGEVFTLAQLSSGSFFGEMALMCNLPRNATVTAQEKCLLASILMEQFQTFEKVTPGVREALDYHARERLLNRMFAFKIPLFQSMSYDDIIKLAETCEIIQFRENEIIIEQGTYSKYFYVLVHGTATLGSAKPSTTSEGENTSTQPPAADSNDIAFRKRVFPGHYFGEVSVILGTTHYPTVCAETKCITLGIPMEAFKKFFSRTPEIWAEFEMRVLGKTNITLKQVLTHGKARELFRQHLDGEFSTESLLFWEAVCEFKAQCKAFKKDEGLSDESMKEKLSIAIKRKQEIIEQYINTDAEKQVNIPDSQRDEIVEKHKNNEDELQLEIFDKAREEVFNLMARDNFKRFKETSLFNDLLQMVNVYTDNDLNLKELEGLKSRTSVIKAIAAEYKTQRNQSVFLSKHL